MKALSVISMIILIVGFVTINAFSQGRPEKGIAYFNDPGLGGSTNAKSCATCHPEGKGLKGVAEKKQYTQTGDVDKALAEVVNQCIVKALKGKALGSNSVELQDMVAYLKTL